MASKDYLGEFEHLVLLAALRLGDDAYAVTIRDEITAQAGRGVSFGAVYSTLRRLETQGLVATRRDEGDDDGRVRKYVDVTEDGVAAVQRSQDRIARMSRGVEVLGRRVARR